MNKKKIKYEWHLYSAVAITGAVTFCGINYSTGTPQVLGGAFGAIVGTFFFSSKMWKNQPMSVHVWSIVISCSIFICLTVKTLLKHFACLIKKITVKNNMNFLKAIGFFFAALIFVLSAVFLSKWINGDSKPITSTTTIPEIIERKMVSCPPDRLSYSTVSQNVKLIDKETAMFAENGKFANPQVIIAKSETSDSKVACGYLFVRAGTKSNGALQDWEDVYINPNSFGGHIISKSAISINDGENYSEYLFSLDRIPYWATSERKSVLNADWAALLNVSNEVKFDIALNTNDKTGFINEIAIAYKCWNPKTGEENTGCKLDVKNKTDIQTNNPVK